MEDEGWHSLEGMNQVSHHLCFLFTHLNFLLMSKVYAYCSRNDCALALLVVDQ